MLGGHSSCSHCSQGCSVARDKQSYIKNINKYKIDTFNILEKLELMMIL